MEYLEVLLKMLFTEQYYQTHQGFFVLDDGTVLKGIVRLENLEDAKIEDEGYLYYGSSYVYSKDIIPIPLTPSILEKNGWKSINGKYALKIKNANYVVLEFTEDGIYTYINENTMLFTIKYIHELQHLLFGLGLNSEMEVQVMLYALRFFDTERSLWY